MGKHMTGADAAGLLPIDTQLQQQVKRQQLREGPALKAYVLQTSIQPFLCDSKSGEGQSRTQSGHAVHMPKRAHSADTEC